jgi:hypothetical protein
MRIAGELPKLFTAAGFERDFGIRDWPPEYICYAAGKLPRSRAGTRRRATIERSQPDSNEQCDREAQD